jgi:hypothetical protein
MLRHAFPEGDEDLYNTIRFLYGTSSYDKREAAVLL